MRYLNRFKRVLYRINVRTNAKRRSVFISKKSYFDRDSFFEGKNNIHEGVNVQGAKIGFATYIGKQSYMKKAVLGRYCSVGANVKVMSNDHPTTFASTHPAFHNPQHALMKKLGLDYFFYAKNENENHSVVIGHDVWIGDDVKIFPNVKIGTGAVIGAGSIVTKDIEPYAIVVGVPARFLKFRFSFENINFLLGSEWWNWPEKKIIEHSVLFSDIDKFKNILGVKSSE